MSQSEFKDCIACAEPIRHNAVLCRHCKTRQDDPGFQESGFQSKGRKQKQSPQKALACLSCGNPDAGDFFCSLCGEQLQNDEPDEINSSLNAKCPRCDSYALSGGVCDTCGYRDLTSDFNDTRSRVQSSARKLQRQSADDTAPAQNSGNSGFALASWVLVIFLIVVGALLSNPSASRSLGDWFSTVFSGQVNYFEKGYQAAKNLDAEKNASQSYAFAFCTVIAANWPSLPSENAVNSFTQGCMKFITEP